MKTIDVEARAVKKGDHLKVDGALREVVKVDPPGRTRKMSWPHVALTVAVGRERVVHDYLPTTRVSIRKR